MSTIISIKSDNSYQVIDSSVSPSSSASDAGWSLLGKTLGYPDSWISIIKERLTREGKSWRWKMTNSTSGSVLLQPMPEEAASILEQGNALLIINKSTPMKAVKDALLLAENRNSEITIVYTSRPPLINDSQTAGEVDQKFTLELEKGRVLLQLVATEAKNLGVKVETSFVWAKSSRDLLKQRDFHADLVMDKTA